MNQIGFLYKKLRQKYGHAAGQWGLWCKRPKTLAEKEEVMIGAILTQNTNWKNVEKSIDALKKAKKCSLPAIHALAQTNPQESKSSGARIPRLQKLIRSSGFYKMKSRYLANIARFFVENGGVARISKMPLPKLRKKLLELKGVGPETADSILLYGLSKPIFVIDEYTRRFVKKERLARDLSYDSLQRLFEKSLPKSTALFQDFHALIVVEGKNGGQGGTRTLKPFGIRPSTVHVYQFRHLPEYGTRIKNKE